MHLEWTAYPVRLCTKSGRQGVDAVELQRKKKLGTSTDAGLFHGKKTKKRKKQ